MNKQKNNPLISVIMPVYNGGEFLHEVIQAILNQTYINFELLIFDDCSSDNSVEIIENFSDKRIKLFKGEKNIGYVKGLNFLIGQSMGEFIARNDQDDISLPSRFEIQIKTLLNNPDIGVCGTQIKTFGKFSKKISYPTTDFDIKTQLIFNVGFHHPTIIFRKELCKGVAGNFYKEEFMPSEDYKLWTMLSQITSFKNTTSILLKYRIHDNNFSSQKIQKQKQNNLKIREQYFKSFLGLSITNKQNGLINKLIYNETILSSELHEIKHLFLDIIKYSQNLLERKSIKTLVFYFWIRACYLNFKKFKNLNTLIFLFNPYLISIEIFSKKYLLKKIL